MRIEERKAFSRRLLSSSIIDMAALGMMQLWARAIDYWFELMSFIVCLMILF